MFIFIEKFYEFFKNIITIAGPVIIILFSLALLAGLVKWTDRTKEWISIISKNPILVFTWILISIILIYFLYKYGIPLFK